MSSFQPPGASGGSRAAAPPSPSQLLETLRRTAIARLQPVLGETQAAVDAELRRRRQGDPKSDASDDDLTNLGMLRSAAPDYERRWQARIGDGFDGWPQQASAAKARDAYSLVSDDQLQSQLVGQPVIDALDRRFVDILDVIDRRLWSLAASLGSQSRPTNPLAPRRLVESFLDTFVASETSPPLRLSLLRHYERLIVDPLGGVYAWINTQLSEAGYAMSTGNDVAMLMASPLGNLGAPAESAKNSLWSDDNALTPTDSTWRDGRRGGVSRARRDPHDAIRGNGLRERARARRQASTATADAAPRRELRSEEFLAVLSLLQGDGGSVSGAEGGIGAQLRHGLADGASGLGIERDTNAPSDAQDDAIDLVGQLFDGLAGAHDLSDAALASLGRLAAPYLRLALSDPYLFDDPDHPAMVLLSLLVQSWDANHRDNDVDAELHTLADEAAQDVIAGYHGNEALFAPTLVTLQQALEPLRKRTEIAERRAWQSIQGRERLQTARREADRQLARLQPPPLLETVAQFLDDQWRQSLIHTWLRDGPQSEAFAAAVAVGDAIVAIDADAARASGHRVAEGLIALQTPLRACYVACGLDESGASQLLAQLVGELAQPDALRTARVFTPLVDGDAAAVESGPVQDDVAVGQVLVLSLPDRPSLSLRLAWRSPLSGSCLLVTRQGAKHSVADAGGFAAMLADGRLQARPVDGAVEGVLARLARTRD